MHLTIDVCELAFCRAHGALAPQGAPRSPRGRLKLAGASRAQTVQWKALGSHVVRGSVAMDSAQKRPGGVARALRPLAFCAFFTTLLVYSPNVMALRGGDVADLTSCFAEPMLALTFVLAAAQAARSMRPAPDAGRTRWGEVVLCALYVAGGCLFAGVIAAQPPFGAQLAYLAAVLVAVGVVPVCVAWTRCLADLSLPGVVGLMSVTSVVSVACNVALKALSAPVSSVAFAVLLVCGTAWPLVRLVRAGGGGDDSSAPEARPLASDAAPSLRAFVSVMGVPLLGMAISSFAMGVQPGFLFGESVDAQHVGMLVAAVALVPLAVARVRGPLFSFVYQAYLPAASVVALVLCSFPASSLAYECGLAATYALYAMISAVGVATACAAANAGEFPRELTMASLVGVFCAFGILGIFLGARLADLISNNAAVLVVLTCAYGCCLMLSGCVKSWRLTVSPQTDAPAETRGTRPAEDGGESFEERLARVASQGGLSPRETEVLGYVGRGHSSVYVAKTLLISESTVYTHVRNVYRKLGVSSREELISLLNADGRG